METRSELSFGQTMKLALKATAISYAGANAVYYWTSQQFLTWRQPRTEYAFHPGFLLSPWMLLLAVVVGAAVVQSRSIFLPALLSVIVVAAVFPTFAWSGPQDLFVAIWPLMMVKLGLMFLALLVDILLVYLWIAPWQSKGKPKIEVAPHAEPKLVNH